MSLEIQISSSLLLTSANKRRTFFISLSAFWSFFSEIMLESLECGLYTSAAYTRDFTVISSESQYKVTYFSITQHLLGSDSVSLQGEDKAMKRYRSLNMNGDVVAKVWYLMVNVDLKFKWMLTYGHDITV